MEVADNGLEHRLGPLLPGGRPTVQKKPQRRSKPRSLRRRILEPLPSRVIELDVRDILAPEDTEVVNVVQRERRYVCCVGVYGRGRNLRPGHLAERRPDGRLPLKS